jgi:hypothetical protein
MGWHRERAAAPGLYLLEGWKPRISIGMDKVECKLISHETGETKTRTIFEPRPELMYPERLREILTREMKELLEEVGLENNRRVLNFIHNEIDELLEINAVEEPKSFQYQRVDKEGRGEKVLVTIFELGDGEYESIPVTDNVYEYVNGTEYAGGIEIDFVKEGVSDKLSQYPIDEYVIEQVIDDVIEILESEGVKFHY